MLFLCVMLTVLPSSGRGLCPIPPLNLGGPLQLNPTEENRVTPHIVCITFKIRNMKKRSFKTKSNMPCNFALLSWDALSWNPATML